MSSNTNEAKKYLGFAAVFFLVVYLFTLVQLPLFMPDETRYAEVPREMLASGNWVVPQLNGLDYFEKPVMGYWVYGIAQLIFGGTPFAVRLPSALAAGLVCLILFFGFRKRMETSTLALACLIYPTFLLVMALGKIGVLDSLFNLFLTGALVFFFNAATAEALSGRRKFLILAGLATCAAFLTKGFVAFAVISVVVVPYLAWERRWRDFWHLSWLPTLTVIVFALPWSLMVASQEGDFWHYFIWVEHFQRFLKPEVAQHPEPVFYYLPILILGTLPWTFLAPASFLRLKESLLSKSMLRYLVCWALFPLLFFTISSGKLATYILPIFPPLSLLMAAGLTAGVGAKKGKVLVGGALALVGVLGVVVLALLLGFSKGSFNASQQTFLILSLFAMAMFLVIGLMEKRSSFLAFFAISPLLFYAAIPTLLPDAMLQKKTADRFFRTQLTRIDPNSRIVSSGNLVQAVCWYTKRNDILVYKTPGEMLYGLERQDAAGRFLDDKNLADTLATATVENPVVFFLPIREWHAFSEAFPGVHPDHMDQNKHFVFVKINHHNIGQDLPGDEIELKSGQLTNVNAGGRILSEDHIPYQQPLQD